MLEHDIKAIKSYVLRQGRLTDGQKRVLQDFWKDYGLHVQSGLLNYPAIFHREAPVVLEIGFGNGESLATMASDFPEHDYIGVEVHRPGVGHLIMHLQSRELINVRCYNEDVNLVLEQSIPKNSLSRVQIFFPDPWPKKRHHKRRLIQAKFIERLVQRLVSGGVLHLATDWENYADQMLGVLKNERALVNLAASHGYHPRPSYRPQTKFEKRGIEKGHGVWDLLFQKL